MFDLEQLILSGADHPEMSGSRPIADNSRQFPGSHGAGKLHDPISSVVIGSVRSSVAIVVICPLRPPVQQCVRLVVNPSGRVCADARWPVLGSSMQEAALHSSRLTVTSIAILLRLDCRHMGRSRRLWNDRDSRSDKH